MILTAHLLTGAALVSEIQTVPLALVLAFLSHYFLDSIPHQEYSIDNIINKRWKKTFFDFTKVFLDISFGVLLICIFRESPLLLLGAFLAILPDGFSLLYLIRPKNLEFHQSFHQKLHFSETKKIPLFWKIFSQLIVCILAILFLA